MGHFPKRDRSMASPISSPQPPPGHVFSRAHEHQKADGRSSRATDRIEVTSFSSNRRPHHAPDPFFRISRSSRSVLTSRRSRPSSSRSSVVRPSARTPSSRSACATQLRVDCAVGSNNSSGVRPDRTSSTSRRRNSSGYGGRDLAIVNSSSPERGLVSTKAGQLHLAPLAIVAARIALRSCVRRVVRTSLGEAVHR
jgi:hypothetical protein